MAKGKAISSGKYVGKESRRKGVVVDGVRYISKCPFGTYYCCDTVGKKGNRASAKERMETVQQWKREVLNISVAFPSFKNMATTVLEQIFFAEKELSFYNANDIICEQVPPQGKKQTSARKMKSRYSSLSGQVSEMFEPVSDIYAKCTYF